LVSGAFAACNALWGVDDLSFEAMSTSSGAGGALACEPGETTFCYAGPEGTEGVGVCRGGQQICASDGSGFGDCEQQVVPGAETCTSTDDEDCDGFDCGDTLWALRFGGTGDEVATAVATDGEGNVIVTGCYETSTDLGGGLFPEPTIDAGHNGFVAKLSPEGEHLYSFSFGAGGANCGTDVAVDPDGNAYVTVRFSTSVQLDIGGIDPRGGVDSLLIKVAPDGRHEWAQHIGGSGGDYAFAVAWGPGGRLVVVGTFENTVDFGGGQRTSAGGGDVFVVRYDGDGNHVFSRRFGGNDHDSGRAVAVDSTGEVVLAGLFAGAMSIGNADLVSAGGEDAFVARLTADGSPEWAYGWGGAGVDRLLDVAIAEDNTILLAGRFEGAATLGSGGPTLQAEGGDDGLVAWLSPTGQIERHLQLGPEGDQVVSTVAVGPAGAVTVAGHFVDQLVAAGREVTGSHGANVFVGRLAADGSLERLQAYEQPSTNTAPTGVFVGWRAAAVDVAGNPLLATYISGDLDVGTETLELAGGTDGVVLKLSH
jgi:hypothetical protein